MCITEPCAVGKYWISGGCEPCPHDMYQDEEGQVGCKDCPQNQFSDEVGATANTTCKCKYTNMLNGEIVDLIKDSNIIWVLMLENLASRL